MSTVWMQVTKDKYELPIAVARTARELAGIVGKTESNIRSSIYHAERKGRRCRYVQVDIGEES